MDLQSIIQAVVRAEPKIESARRKGEFLGERLPVLDALVSRLKNAFDFSGRSYWGFDASYDYNVDKIHVNEPEFYTSWSMYYRVVIHECAHASGHPTRLNRPTIREAVDCGSMTDMNRTIEEAVAEMCTGLILQHLTGESNFPAASANYIARQAEYCQMNREELVKAAYPEAIRAMDWLLACAESQKYQITTTSEASREAA